VWSSIGVSLAIAIGEHNFLEFLGGGMKWTSISAAPLG